MESILRNVFKCMPSHFITRWVSEFYDGKARIQHRISNDVIDAVKFEFYRNVVATIHANIRQLFGATTMKQVSISVSDVLLPPKPVRESGNNKLESILTTYSTILEQYTSYYSTPTFDSDNIAEQCVMDDAEEKIQLRAKNKRLRLATVARGARLTVINLSFCDSFV